VPSKQRKLEVLAQKISKINGMNAQLLLQAKNDRRLQLVLERGLFVQSSHDNSPHIAGRRSTNGRVPPLTPAARKPRAEDAMKLNSSATGPEDRLFRAGALENGDQPFIRVQSRKSRKPHSRSSKGPMNSDSTGSASTANDLHGGRPLPPQNIHLYSEPPRGHWRAMYRR